MQQIVIGQGEIGVSLRNVLDCDICDTEGPKGKYDVIHICFPYSKTFIDTVKKYQEDTGAYLTIIHSTVPVGTSEKLDAVHSPVRGIHPHLEESLRTFVKFCGGKHADTAVEVLSMHGIHAVAVNSSRDTEAGKIWSTTGYGLNIILEKAIHKYCEENGLNFDVVYSMFNETYNKGYEKMGMPQFQKYNLEHRPGGIGGHCIRQNLELIENDLVKDLKKYIERYTN